MWADMISGIMSVYELKRMQEEQFINAQQQYLNAYRQYQNAAGGLMSNPQMVGNTSNAMAGNAMVSLQSLYGYASLYPYGASHGQAKTVERDEPGAGSGRADELAIRKREEEKQKRIKGEENLAKWSEILDRKQRANAGQAAPKLSLKTTPLFRHLRYKFDSPFKPLHKWLIRWILSWRLS